MGVVGLEPTQPCDQQILSLVRLPFRHTPKFTCKGKSIDLIIKSDSVQVSMPAVDFAERGTIVGI